MKLEETEIKLELVNFTLVNEDNNDLNQLQMINSNFYTQQEFYTRIDNDREDPTLLADHIDFLESAVEKEVNWDGNIKNKLKLVEWNVKVIDPSIFYYNEELYQHLKILVAPEVEYTLLSTTNISIPYVAGQRERPSSRPGHRSPTTKLYFYYCSEICYHKMRHLARKGQQVEFTNCICVPNVRLRIQTDRDERHRAARHQIVDRADRRGDVVIQLYTFEELRRMREEDDVEDDLEDELEAQENNIRTRAPALLPSERLNLRNIVYNPITRETYLLRQRNERINLQLNAAESKLEALRLHRG